MTSNKRIKGGFLVTFEGPECAGKSTQQKLLAAYLRALGYEVCETREPGGTRVGEEVRKLVKHLQGDEAVCDEAELLLFCASRAQLMHKVILPHLASGGIVISDRFADSTTAYQGYARGIDRDLIARLHRLSLKGRWPDLTLLLDLEITQALNRGQMRLESLFIPDRIEDESQKFHEQVRAGYLAIAAAHPERIVIINADQDREELHHRICTEVHHALGRIH